MLVARFLDGLAGSAFLSVAGGTVGDLFARSELSLPMMIYTASPFLGPELGECKSTGVKLLTVRVVVVYSVSLTRLPLNIGPVIGGFINQFANWRWSFWVLVIWSGIYWVFIFAFVPETYAPVSQKTLSVKVFEYLLTLGRYCCAARPSNYGRRQATAGTKHPSRSWTVPLLRLYSGAVSDRFNCLSLNQWFSIL